MTSLEADTGTTRLRCELPRSADVRRVIESVRADFPGTDLVARRDTARPSRTERDVRRALFEGTTDRQRTALETAYHAGLYEWPRASTVEEVADSLHISGPTFSKHHRAAERKLLRAVFDDR